MHFPFVFQIGSLEIPAHAFFEAAAFFFGFRYFLYLRKKQGDLYPSTTRAWIIIGAIFGALAGSRLVGALENPLQLIAAKNVWLYIYANKTVLGGFLGGLLGVELTKKCLHEKKASGDLFVYPMILALIIGRLGCFSMGIHEETYGTATNLPWGLYLGDNVKRHPVTLYEILFLLLMWYALKSYTSKLTLVEGALFKAFMITYIFFRFVLDFIKPHYDVIAGLSTIQLTCIIGLLYYLPYMLHPKKLKAAYA